jgi:hypothetical protein
MPNWKKVITSGSDAQLNSLYVTNAITASSDVLISGNVGIGTETPDHKLFVSGSEQCLSVFKSSTNGAGIVFMDNGTTDDFSVGLGAFDDHLCFLAGGTQQMRLLDNGNFGIGTLTPVTKLHVDGTISSSKFETIGHISASIVSASTYYGDGSNLTGISAGGGSIFALTGSVYATTNDLEITGSLTVIDNLVVTQITSSTLDINAETSIYKSGSTVFNVEGSSGQLFSITDTLSGSLYSVNDISGLPIFEVFSDDTIIAGAYNQNDFVITGSKVGIGTATPTVKLNIEYDDNAFSGGLLLKNINTGSNAFSALSLLSADYTNGFSLSQGNSDGNIRMYNGDDTDMIFYTNASERIRITANGDVGIGKSSTSSKLDISGSLTVTGSIKTEVVALSVASNTASMDCTLSNSFTLNLVGGADTYLNPTNIQSGQSLNLKITQDGVEAGTVSYGTNIKFSNILPYSASSTLSAIDIVSFASFDSTTLYGSALKDFN